MIELRRAESLGGNRKFRGAAEIVLWLNKESQAWLQLMNAALVNQNLRLPNFVQLLQKLSREMESQENAPDQVLERSLNTELGDYASRNSDVGESLSQVFSQVGYYGFIASLVAAGVEPGSIDWSDPQQLAGIVCYQRSRQLTTDFELASKAAEQGAIVESKISQAQAAYELQQELLTKSQLDSAQIATTLQGCQDASRRLQEQATHEVNDAIAQLGKTIEDINNERVSAQALISNAVDEANTKITAFQKTHEEQRRLESASALWDQRGTGHKANAKVLRNFAAGAGAVGFLITFVVFVVAYWAIQWMLGVQTQPLDTASNELAVSQELRPTFVFEIGFASAATLAWLTLFIWTMRLIIRAYTTEQHLAIDAEARSALTNTYFSLTKDDKADKEDRAIVLASIFRPVMDGMIKDEGPPAFTPAAILSSLVTPKS